VALGIYEDDNFVCNVISVDGLLNDSLVVKQTSTTFAKSYFGAVWLPTASVRPGDVVRGYAVFRTRLSPYSSALVLESKVLVFFKKKKSKKKGNIIKFVSLETIVLCLSFFATFL